jgi:hypothetical protein
LNGAPSTGTPQANDFMGRRPQILWQYRSPGKHRVPDGMKPDGETVHHEAGVRVLYISYDGLLEPLGYSQVYEYLRVLAKAHEIFLITFEKAADWQDAARCEALRKEVEAAGIRWHPLRYHKRPTVPATFWDIAVGMAVGFALVLKHRIELIHARSYVPSLIALWLKKVFKSKFLFDMRGFWADEKVDARSWSEAGALYRITKRLEKSLLLNADVVV